MFVKKKEKNRHLIGYRTRINGEKIKMADLLSQLTVIVTIIYKSFFPRQSLITRGRLWCSDKTRKSCCLTYMYLHHNVPSVTYIWYVCTSVILRTLYRIRCVARVAK